MLGERSNTRFHSRTLWLCKDLFVLDISQNYQFDADTLANKNLQVTSSSILESCNPMLRGVRHTKTNPRYFSEVQYLVLIIIKN
jgi:hypothetical protein